MTLTLTMVVCIIHLTVRLDYCNVQLFKSILELPVSVTCLLVKRVIPKVVLAQCRQFLPIPTHIAQSIWFD